MKKAKTPVYLTSVLVLYWIASRALKSEWLPGMLTTFDDLQKSFLNFVEPRIERSLIKVPEAYMTTVSSIASSLRYIFS